jgi:hypothetical protein
MHDTYKQYEHSAIQPFSGSGVQQCCTVTAAPSSAELGRQAGLGLPAAIATRKGKGAGDLVGAWLSGSYVRASPTCFCFANTARLDGADRAGGRPQCRVVVHQPRAAAARGKRSLPRRDGPGTVQPSFARGCTCICVTNVQLY